MATEREKERSRRYYQRHRAKRLAAAKAWRRKAGSRLARAIAQGPAALDAYRKYERERRRYWRDKKRGGPPRGRGRGIVKLIVTIPPNKTVPEQARAMLPNLRELIDGVGKVAVRRHRRKAEARRDFAVWEAAASSLPECPAPAEIKAWLDALGRGEHGGAPLLPGTLNNLRFRLHLLYESARIIKGTISWNPVREVELVKDPRREMRLTGLTYHNIAAAFARMLVVCRDRMERDFVSLLRYTGLRLSEVLGLRREHILVDGPSVSLHVLTQRRAWEEHDDPLKSTRQRRVLPIANPELCDILRRLRNSSPAQMAGHRRFDGVRWILSQPAASPYLFPLRGWGVKRLAQRLRVAVPELAPGIMWHAFRHAFAAEARIRGNASVDELSQWLGHSSTDVTRVYLRTLLGEEPALDDFSARVAAAQLRRPVAARVRRDTT